MLPTKSIRSSHVVKNHAEMKFTFVSNPPSWQLCPGIHAKTLTPPSRPLSREKHPTKCHHCVTISCLAGLTDFVILTKCVKGYILANSDQRSRYG